MNWLNCFNCKEKTIDDVKMLDYNRTGLTDVPPEVFNFERTLETLYLDGNKISELPRMLFQCEELKNLDVSDNDIQSLPGLISKLVNLHTLNLSRNCLKYTDIPVNIHRCQKLTVLDLSSNTLDKVPEGLTSLVNLEELYLNDCYIEYLPANFGRLCNLKILELRDNNITALPKSLRRMTALQRLDLSNNDLSDMPEVIGNMCNLKELWLNGNCIGSLNPSIGNLQNLIDFDASKNDLEGLPREIGNCTKLTSLIFSNNLLKSVPNCIGKLSQLQILKLDYNFLESLPSTIGDLTNLEELDVQNNQLVSLPTSIGFLRKLNILIASHNFLAHLPSEIGSCIALSIINLHNNMLKKLPDEIGHLQNLTSLGLIGNKLEYLPIPVTNLPHLRALWLTQNQSHPLIPLQREKLEMTGQLVLTCFLLPQIESVPQEVDRSETPSVVSPKRHICFTEAGLTQDPPPKLTRAPTPYPKELQRFQRSLSNQLRKNREATPQSINVNVDPGGLVIKEAKVTPMKNDVNTDGADVSMYNTQRPLYISSESKLQAQIKNGTQDNLDAQMYDNTNQYLNHNQTEQSQNFHEILSEDPYGTRAIPSDVPDKPTKQPPPYHIAAAYSKNAKYFNNMEDFDSSQLDKPQGHIVKSKKTDTKETATNDLNDYYFKTPEDSSTKVDPLGNNLEYAQMDKRDHYDIKTGSFDTGNNNREQSHLRLNEDKTSPKLLKVVLTPCCYVLGFSIIYNEHGVFVHKVDENGNAHHKLYPGDKILMLDEQDLTKMHPWQAYKTVLIQGPEAESFFISRL